MGIAARTSLLHHYTWIRRLRSYRRRKCIRDLEQSTYSLRQRANILSLSTVIDLLGGFFHFPHRNTGLPNLQESYVGTLFPRSVHNGPSSLLYGIYTHCVCIYGGIFCHFYRFFGFFMDFMDFLGFFTFLLDFLLAFPFCFYSAFT